MGKGGREYERKISDMILGRGCSFAHSLCEIQPDALVMSVNVSFPSSWVPLHLNFLACWFSKLL